MVGHNVEGEWMNFAHHPNMELPTKER